MSLFSKPSLQNWKDNSTVLCLVFSLGTWCLLSAWHELWIFTKEIIPLARSQPEMIWWNTGANTENKMADMFRNFHYGDELHGACAHGILFWECKSLVRNMILSICWHPLCTLYFVFKGQVLENAGQWGAEGKSPSALGSLIEHRSACSACSRYLCTAKRSIWFEEMCASMCH